jgi:hypothetical protein
LFYVASFRLFFGSRGHLLNVSFAGFGFRLKPSDSKDFRSHIVPRSLSGRSFPGMSNGDIFGNLEKLNDVPGCTGTHKTRSCV